MQKSAPFLKQKKTHQLTKNEQPYEAIAMYRYVQD